MLRLVTLAPATGRKATRVPWATAQTCPARLAGRALLIWVTRSASDPLVLVPEAGTVTATGAAPLTETWKWASLDNCPLDGRPRITTAGSLGSAWKVRLPTPELARGWKARREPIAAAWTLAARPAGRALLISAARSSRDWL